MSTIIYSRYDRDGRPLKVRKAVGRVDPPYFKKKVDSRVHFLRVPPAICFDAETLGHAEAAGATRVAVVDERREWRVCAMEVLRAKSFELDRGHGRQVALPMQWWRPGERSALALAEELANGPDQR